MLFEEQKMLVSKNSDNFWYVINLKTGFKFVFEIFSCKARGCADEISENDIKRAKDEDDIDISNILNSYGNIDEEKEKIGEFLKSPRFPFGIVKEVI